jgi:type III restriction enzyme
LKSRCASFLRTCSKDERTFVDLLDTGTEIEVYAKLPKAFSIPTPVRAYTPNWAIAFKQGTVKHIFYIAKAKDSMLTFEIRPIEETKIMCARYSFGIITSDLVKYNVVDSYSKLTELVH